MLSIGLVSVVVVISNFLLWLLLVCGYVRRYGTCPPAAAPAGNCAPPTCSSESYASDAGAEAEPVSEGLDSELASPAQPSCSAAAGTNFGTGPSDGEVATDAPGGSGDQAADVCAMVGSEKEAVKPTDDTAAPPATDVPVMMPAMSAAEPSPQDEEAEDAGQVQVQPPVTPKLDARGPLPDAVQPKFKPSPRGDEPREGVLAPPHFACCMPCATTSAAREDEVAIRDRSP